MLPLADPLRMGWCRLFLLVVSGGAGDCSRSADACSLRLLLVRNDGRVGRRRRVGHQSTLLITRYRIGIRIVVLGWLAASTLTGVGNWFGDIGL